MTEGDRVTTGPGAIRFTVDGVKYEMDPQRLRNIEAIALQKVTGLKVIEFYEQVEELDATAITGLVWLAKRRNGEDVKFSELDFDLIEVMQSMEPVDDQADEDEPADPTPPLDEASSSGEPER